MWHIYWHAKWMQINAAFVFRLDYTNHSSSNCANCGPNPNPNFPAATDLEIDIDSDSVTREGGIQWKLISWINRFTPRAASQPAIEILSAAHAKWEFNGSLPASQAKSEWVLSDDLSRHWSLVIKVLPASTPSCPGLPSGIDCKRTNNFRAANFIGPTNPMLTYGCQHIWLCDS